VLKPTIALDAIVIRGTGAGVPGCQVLPPTKGFSAHAHKQAPAEDHLETIAKAGWNKLNELND